MVEACGNDSEARASEARSAASFLNTDMTETQFGAPKAGVSKWASIIRVIDPIRSETHYEVELDQDEAAFSYDLFGVLMTNYIILCLYCSVCI